MCILVPPAFQRGAGACSELQGADDLACCVRLTSKASCKTQNRDQHRTSRSLQCYHIVRQSAIAEPLLPPDDTILYMSDNVTEQSMREAQAETRIHVNGLQVRIRTCTLSKSDPTVL